MIEIYHERRNKFDPHNVWGVKLYLDNPEGFPTKSEVKRTYAKLPIPQSFWKSKGIIKNIDLDEIYAVMNTGDNPMSWNSPDGDKMQQWIKDHDTHTSTSIGDVIAINGKFYVCDKGWPRDHWTELK